MLENLLKMLNDLHGVNPEGRQFALDYVKQEYGDDASHYLDSIILCRGGRFHLWNLWGDLGLSVIINQIEKSACKV